MCTSLFDFLNNNNRTPNDDRFIAKKEKDNTCFFRRSIVIYTGGKISINSLSLSRAVKKSSKKNYFSIFFYQTCQGWSANFSSDLIF